MATEKMATIEVDEDNMEQIADEAATLYLTSISSEWGVYHWAKSFPRYFEIWFFEPYFGFLCGYAPNQKMKQYNIYSKVQVIWFFLVGYDWLHVGLGHLTTDAPCKFLGTNLQRFKPKLSFRCSCNSDGIHWW